MIVDSKRKSVELQRTGGFGNNLHVWLNADDYLNSGYTGLIALRYMGPHGGMWLKYDIPMDEVLSVFDSWCSEGADPRLITFNEAAPCKKVIVQGEYWNGGKPVDYFFHSRELVHMRDALKISPKHSIGLVSRVIIKHAMTPSSWEDWNVLIDQYPNHVLEVSIYNCCLGTIPGRNSIVWEIRRY